MLFTQITQEPDKKVRHCICDAIGEIAASLLQNEEVYNQVEWPDFIKTLF